MALTTNKKKSTNSIMKSLYTGDTEFQLTINEIGEKLFHCNILKDMSAISFSDSKLLQKNAVILTQVLEPLNETGTLLQDKKNDLNERSAKEGQTEQLIKDRNALKDDSKIHNTTRHKVMLFCIPEENFPTDKEKYGAKKVNNNGMPTEINRFDSFLELYGNIITEKKT